MMPRLIPIAVLLAGLALSTAAWAHAHLVKAVPAVGATVAAADTLRLMFSEAIEIKFSKVEVTADKGVPVQLGAVALDPADDKTVVLSLPGRLPAGAYTVHWHVVSVDTHRTEGTYTFTVK
jgi:methionine-rich copper-binding protein CopC